ncbi:MAG: outer membrane beta-barrel protein [Bacteroidota bacterium]
MHKKVLLGVLILTSIQMVSQDKKWSIEANYPISVGDDLGNDNPGILDIGLKYRFLDFNIVQLGAGINTGVFRDNIESFTIPSDFDFTETNWVIQPKVFAEFRIPALKRLRPSIGLGYTIIRSRFKGDIFGRNEDTTNTDGGLNLNLGVSYDIAKWLFIQAQYDYVRFNIREEGFPDINDDLGFLKAGVGFRF